MELQRISLHRKTKLLAGLVCGILLFAALSSYLHRETAPQGVRQSRPLVRVAQVHRADMMRHINLSGQTVAEADIALAPKYTGRVAEVAPNAKIVHFEIDPAEIQDKLNSLFN